MTTVHRAAWVLPIVAPPIRGGFVAIEHGRIVDVGSDSRADVPNVAILPGLVNAHTHLELSWMEGEIPPGEAMPAWAGRLIGLRRTKDHDPREPIVNAIRQAFATGTTLVGDVTNTLAACEPIAESGLSAAIFYELLGFRAPDPVAQVAEAR